MQEIIERIRSTQGPLVIRAGGVIRARPRARALG